MDKFHVFIYKGKYSFRRSGKPRAIRTFSSEQEAIEYGILYMVRRKGGIMWVHYPNALIKRHITLYV